MCSCNYYRDGRCAYFDYASGKSEDGYCSHDTPKYAYDDDEVEEEDWEIIVCDTYNEDAYDDEEE